MGETIAADPGGKMPGPSGWLERVGWNGPPDRPAGLAVCYGYDARQPGDHPTPFQPTELLPFENERL
ncbi:hypothetical protein IP85_18745 [Rhizobium sp. AAP116]|nr:hypothetical protein IP85_18745 [Rhizobium sp. AAP116]